MNRLLRHALVALAVGAGALAVAAWAVPDSVVELIARDRPVLLGRYSVGHVSAAIVLSLVALALTYVASAPPALVGERCLGLAVFTVTLILGLAAADAILRLGFDDRSYVHVGELRLRPPDLRHRMTYVDAPLARRSLPVLEPGYPPFELVMTTDARGFRNPGALDRADMVLVGDSFTEGSRVSDEQTWGRLLGQRTGLRVYNIANSGDDPAKYVAKLERYGLPLGPRHVLVMLYEGNDFRRGATDEDVILDPGTGFAVGRYLRFSPLRLRLKRLLINTLGPIHADGPVAGAELLDWLPLALDYGGRRVHYAMPPKHIARLGLEPDEFRDTDGWRGARAALADLQRLARDAGARLEVVFAPTMAHVVLPMVRPTLPAQRLKDYTMLRPGPLPERLRDEADPDRFVDAVLAGAASAEQVTRAWCEENGVPFLSLTEAMRDATRAGEQVYYTYDQHWSPDGHRIAAAVIADWWSAELE